MKKLTYLLAAFVLVFTTACDPMEDVYDEIGNTEKVITGDVEYELTDDDYEDLDLSFGNFSSMDDAKALIPGLLTEKYPVWGEGSTALTTFKLYVGRAFSIDDYNLVQDDYTAAGSDFEDGFASDQNPSTLVPEIINTNLGSGDEGDYVVAQYSQYSGDAYIITPFDNFDYGNTATDLITAAGGTWINHNGTENQLQYNTTGLTMSGYPLSDVGGSIAISSSGSEDVHKFFGKMDSGKVYLSALVNLSEVNGGTYFLHLMEGSGFAYVARVGVKTDGAGQALFGIGASSSTLTYGDEKFDLDTTYLVVASYEFETGTANLYVMDAVSATEPASPVASNTGNTGYTLERMAVRQGSGGSSATIDGIRVTDSWSAIMTTDQMDEIIVGDKSSYQASFVYSGGNWEETGDDFYVLTTEDYDSMGEAYGQPGRYNNFDSNMDPDVYIPLFLSQKFPYAMDEDVMDVSYKYYSGGVQVRGNRYTFMNGEWHAHTSVINTSLQFGHDGSTWVPDNTIKYTITSADLSLIISSLSSKYPDQCDNLNDHGNFVRKSDWNTYWSDEMLVEAFNIVLDNMHSSAEENQKYQIIFEIYTGSSVAIESMNLIKQGGVWVLNN